jgi:hypothetical protein
MPGVAEARAVEARNVPDRPKERFTVRRPTLSRVFRWGAPAATGVASAFSFFLLSYAVVPLAGLFVMGGIGVLIGEVALGHPFSKRLHLNGLEQKIKVKEQELVVSKGDIDQKDLDLVSLNHQIDTIKGELNEEKEKLHQAILQIQITQVNVLYRLQGRIPVLSRLHRLIEQAIFVIEQLPKDEEWKEKISGQLESFHAQEGAIKQEIADLETVVKRIEKDGLHESNDVFCREVGEGGMGRIELFYYVLEDVWVVKKTLKAEHRGNPELVARFMKEAEIAKTLRHPNLAQGFDSGLDQNGTPFYTSEFIRGRSLRQILNSDPQDPEKGVPLRPARAATIALQVLDGLDYLAEFKYKVTNQAEDGQVVEKEAKGIIHRDLKPENILIDDSRSPSDRGYIKIVDMGLAREVAVSTLTATGFGMGTPVYMAPEQVEGRRDLDPRTDLFAAGTIIYEMLTGRTLFSGMERLDKKVDELVKKAQGIPDELKPTLTGVLRYERNYRPARAVLRKAIMKLWEQEEQTTQKAG